MTVEAERGDRPAVRPAACYARKSTPDDIGVTRQIELCAERAVSDGYVIPDHPLFRYGDDMTSGAALTRLDFDRLLDFVASGEAPFDMVFVKDQTRFGRFNDPGEHFVNLHRLMKAGVRVTFLSSATPYDPTNGGEFMAEAARAYFAREERQTLIRRVTGGMVGSIHKGLYPGNPIFGLQRWYACKRSAEPRMPVDETRVAPGKDEAYVLRWAEDGSRDVVVSIFQWCADGLSLRAIARRLRDEVGTVNAMGKPSWSPTTVRGILRNPIYMGDLLWRRERAGHPLDDPQVRDGLEAAMLGCRRPFRVRGFLPDAPISPELFRAVQHVLEGNRNERGERVGRKRSSPRYLLSGLVECSECEGRYHGFTARHGLRYYRHARVPAGAGVCSAANRYRRADALEPPVEDLVESLLKEHRFVEAASRALQGLIEREGERDMERELRDLQRDRKGVSTRMDRLTEELARLSSPSAVARVRQGIEGLGHQLDALEAREREIGSRSEDLKQMERSLPAVNETAARLARAFRSGDDVARRNTLREVIRRILVAPDGDEARIEVTVPGLTGPA